MPTTCDRSYPLVHPELVEAVLFPYDAELTGGCLPAELREISPASAKLLVAGPPKLPSRCRLRLVSSKLMRTLEIPAEIGWARPNPAGDWLVECEFSQRTDRMRQFAELAVQRLARTTLRGALSNPHCRGGRMDPGARPRSRHRARSFRRWAMPDDQPAAAAIPERACHRARRQQGEAILRLKVRWSLSVGQNHLIGCQFIRGEDFFLLRKLQPSSPAAIHGTLAGRPPNCRLARIDLAAAEAELLLGDQLLDLLAHGLFAAAPCQLSSPYHQERTCPRRSIR